jgi:hypothetical protein
MDKPRHKIHDTDSKMFLKPMLKEACQKHKVSDDVQAKLIENGVKQFSTFSDGSVIPTGFYKTVDQYVEKHRHDKSSDRSPAKNTKEQLLAEMGRHAKAGNMTAYRECRAKYTESLMGKLPWKPIMSFLHCAPVTVASQLNVAKEQGSGIHTSMVTQAKIMRLIAAILSQGTNSARADQQVPEIRWALLLWNYWRMRKKPSAVKL